MKTHPLFLYIAQPGDTVDHIAVKFNTTAEDVRRFNPVLKVREPHAGQPINIFDLRDLVRNKETEMLLSETETNIRMLWSKIAFYIKESILSNIFFQENLLEARAALEKLFLNLIQTYYKIKDPEIANIIKSKLININDKFIDFVAVAKEKNAIAIQNYKNELETLCYDFTQFLLNNAQNIDEAKTMDFYMFANDLWQYFILRILTKKYDQAQEIFNKILENYDNFAISLEIDKKISFEGLKK